MNSFKYNENLTLKGLKIQKKYSFFFKEISSLENLQIRKIEINRPIFICSLPRSGTTFTLNAINSLSNQVAGTSYKYLPFIVTPIIWNKFSKIFYGKRKLVKRIHGDKVFVNESSLESFDQIIWNYFIGEDSYKYLFEDNFYKDEVIRFIDKEYSNFIKKVLYIEKKDRFINKNNYLISKLPYLIDKFPNCKIIIPIRNLNDTLNSALNVDKRFCNFSNKLNGFDEFLYLNGHFEFGKKKKFINTLKLNILNSYKKDYEIYIDKIYSIINSNYKKNIFIFKYEELQESKNKILSELMNFCEIKFDTNKLKNIKFSYKNKGVFDYFQNEPKTVSKFNKIIDFSN